MVGGDRHQRAIPRRSVGDPWLRCFGIALGLQHEHKLAINFDAILYPEGRNTNPKGRRLYEALSNLGKTFVGPREPARD